MIESLHIENLVVVERADLEFGPGLNVLTGETGAGKSVVLAALSLLVGGRASSGTLREGAERASVEALFRTSALRDLEQELVERDLMVPGGEGADSHELVVSRTLAANGRSRARVSGQLVPVSTLAELFSGRVEISSQHSSQALLRPETHGQLLDLAGGLMEERGAVARAYHAIEAIDAELLRLRSESEEGSRRQDYLAFQQAEIEEVGLEPGELVRLAQEHVRLAHAEQLRADGAAALLALSGDEGHTALDLIRSCALALAGMAKLDASAAPMADRLKDAEAELQDLASDLERYVDRVEGDPARLSALEERIGQIEKLRRKYGQSEEEIFAFRDALAEDLSAIEGADTRIDELEQQRGALLDELSDAASLLSLGRAKAGRKLGTKVQRALRELDMPEACFEVALEPAAQLASLPVGVVSGPRGAEAPEFRFSANRGESTRSLQKVASGGELSRVFLALKNALRQAGANMVLVFDEVDAGIGGRAAERVGRALAELANEHQVLCITHLPQIAAFADVHFLVAKREEKGRTSAQITRIEGQERVEEIARMAGGQEITEATRRHARDLLRVKNPK